MLTVRNLSKSYNDLKALDDVSLEVGKGELFGLIGPDGAGKTTLFRIAATLMLADKGEVFFDGRNVVDDYQYVRNHIGYMPGKFSLYQDLSVRENLEFFARVMKTSIEENRYLIDDIYRQLEPFEKRRAGALSGGMKQKLALCCALIHKPLMLFLDEPTTGVDAVSRKEFWEMLRGLKSQGISILVSTPYMDESNLCDRIALIQKGKIMDINTPNEVVRNFKKKVLQIKGKNLYNLLKEVRTENDNLLIFPFGDSLHAYLKEGEDGLTIFDKYRNEFELETSIIEAEIEDVFMNLMSEPEHGQ